MGVEDFGAGSQRSTVCSDSLLRYEVGVEDGKRNVFIERNPKQEDVMTELESVLDAINCIEIESVNLGAGIISSLSNLMCRCDLYARKSCIKKCE